MEHATVIMTKQAQANVFQKNQILGVSKILGLLNVYIQDTNNLSPHVKEDVNDAVDNWLKTNFPIYIKFIY